MKAMVTSSNILYVYCYTQCPQPCSRPPPTHASAGDSWTLMGKSGSVSCGVTAPFCLVLVHKVLFVPSESSKWWLCGTGAVSGQEEIPHVQG